MFYTVIIKKDKIEMVFKWTGEQSLKLPTPPLPTDKNYSFLQIPEHEDYYKQEESTVKFIFNDIAVAKEVSNMFGDGTIKEIANT